MAVTKDQKVIRFGTEDGHQPTYQPMKANASVYAGTIALTDSTGYAKAATSPASTDTCWGLYNGLVNGTPTTATPVANGTVTGNVLIGIDTGSFYLTPGTAGDALTQANAGVTCYVIDEVTVGATSNGNTRPVAGKFISVGTGQYTGLVAVLLGSNQTTGSP